MKENFHFSQGRKNDSYFPSVLQERKKEKTPFFPREENTLLLRK